MIIDARTMDDGAALDADLCIIGGGPAGLAMAHTFLGTGREVVLLEGGGREWDQDDQALFWGESVGRPYLPLDGSRQRYLGGNSHVWDGWCAPYREGALDPWPWIPDSGWPITAGEIAPYVERAARLIGLPDEGWDPDHWAGRLGVERLPLRQGVLDVYVELIKKTRFADTLGPAIDADPAVKLFLYANLAGIETDAEARRVTGITARTRADGRTLKVRARHYVMAMGGIENARQLLLANEVLPAGLGNRHDVVGRYFADHVSFHGGILQPVDPNLDLGLADRHRRSDVEALARECPGGRPRLSRHPSGRGRPGAVAGGHRGCRRHRPQRRPAAHRPHGAGARGGRGGPRRFPRPAHRQGRWLGSGPHGGPALRACGTDVSGRR
jgi:choline dehydrogenase-like flavoprotein